MLFQICEASPTCLMADGLSSGDGQLIQPGSQKGTEGFNFAAAFARHLTTKERIANLDAPADRARAISIEHDLH